MRRTHQEPTSRSVHLLLSYAVRYPEIATVRYDPRRQTLRLSFLVSGPVPEEEFRAVERKLRETLEVYHMLGQRRALVLEVSHEGLGDLNTIALERDLATLTPEELFTVVEAFRDLFTGRIIAENIDIVGEEELIAQEEIIEEMLASLAERRSNANLIAIREDGRLMLFHK
ncbi:MAG: hypothetical protein ACOY94_21995 [Bacillota bacterium]